MSENAATNSELTVSSTSFGGSVGDYLSLLKPRVMSLVVFTALVGLVVSVELGNEKN